jgi:hypothetical protein
MKKTFILSVTIASYLMLTTSVSALTKVYVKLATDTQAWTNITADANNIVKTIGIGGDYSDFTSIDFNSTGLNLLTGDEVWLAKGSYPFSKQLPTITNAISIYGGFSGTETAVSQRAKSDLDGNGMVEPWEFTNSTKFVGLGNSSSTPQTFRMLILNNGKVLDGITISDIYYTNSGSTTYGGGGEIQTGAIIRNSIAQNITTVCTSNNSVNGGGLYVNRGGMDGCLVENCMCDIQFATNTQTAFGGGVSLIGAGADNTTSCTGYVINSVIRNCTAGSVTGAKNILGGGILANTGGRVENCVIYNNSAIQNSTLGGTAQGGGIYGHTSGDTYLKGVYFVNLTVVNNFSNGYPSFFPASNYASAYNCIVWQNGTGGTAAAPTYTASSVRISATTGITGYPYLDYMFYNTDAVTPITNGTNNQASSFTAYTSKVILSSVDNSSYPGFSRPTTFVGSTTTPSEMAAIRQASWTLTEFSPLINKGVAAPTNTVVTALITASPKVTGGNAFTFSPTDLCGKTRGSIYQLGAYQFLPQVYSKVATPTVINKLKVYMLNGTLQVAGAQGTTFVKVYSVSGKLISSSTITSSSTGIQLPQQGVYFVQVKWNQESEVHKITL